MGDLQKPSGYSSGQATLVALLEQWVGPEKVQPQGVGPRGLQRPLATSVTSTSVILPAPIHLHCLFELRQDFPALRQEGLQLCLLGLVYLVKNSWATRRLSLMNNQIRLGALRGLVVPHSSCYKDWYFLKRIRICRGTRGQIMPSIALWEYSTCWLTNVPWSITSAVLNAWTLYNTLSSFGRKG